MNNISELKDIEGYEGLYAVTKTGEVWSYPKIHGNALWKGFWLKHATEKTGYKFVILAKNKIHKTCYIQGLVAKAYLGNRSNEKMQVNHIDGNKKNNNVENLEWCTASENIRHSFKLGLSNQKGSKNAASKLNEQYVAEIRNLYKNGEKQIVLSKKFFISPSVINRIIKNTLWMNA